MITVISSTDRNKSVTVMVAHIYLKLLSELGYSTQLLDLSEVPVDSVSASAYVQSTPTFSQIETKYFVEAEKLIFVVPEYNGSFPGYLKYVLDACDHRIFRGKKCALTGLASGRGGNLRGLEHLTGILHYLGAEVCSRKVYISQVNSIVQGPGLEHDDTTIKEINSQIAYFVQF